MSYFDRDKRFDELFNDWFDNEFRKYLADNRRLDDSCRLTGSGYLQGMAAAYADIDDLIDQTIGAIRQQVDSEFENWKKEE